MIELIFFYRRLAVFNGPDPALPEAQVIQQAKGDFRRSRGLNKTGKAKKAMSEQLKAAQNKYVAKTLITYHASRSRLSDSSFSGESSSSPHLISSSSSPKKKQRLSVDQQLAIAGKRDLDQNFQESISRVPSRVRNLKRKAM
jgi:hypothetical protein